MTGHELFRCCSCAVTGNFHRVAHHLLQIPDVALGSLYEISTALMPPHDACVLVYFTHNFDGRVDRPQMAALPCVRGSCEELRPSNLAMAIAEDKLPIVDIV